MWHQCCHQYVVKEQNLGEKKKCYDDEDIVYNNSLWHMHVLKGAHMGTWCIQSITLQYMGNLNTLTNKTSWITSSYMKRICTSLRYYVRRTTYKCLLQLDFMIVCSVIWVCHSRWYVRTTCKCSLQLHFLIVCSVTIEEYGQVTQGVM